MATVKKGILTPAGEWWKHLRWTKRMFWKGERKAARREAGNEARSDLRPESRGRIGSELAAFGRECGGLELDIARDPAPIEPANFE